MNKDFIFEVACFDLESAKAAIHTGANRIELCIDYTKGGLTPPEEWLYKLKTLSDLPIYVMLRSKSTYFQTNEDFTEIKKFLIKSNILTLADGFVWGAITTDRTIDTESLDRLLDLTGNIPLTFHRAIDHTRDIHEALDCLLSTPVKSILTSGFAKDLNSGIRNFSTILANASNKLEVIAGGQLDEFNAPILYELGVRSFHTAAIHYTNESLSPTFSSQRFEAIRSSILK
ncbi:MAG: copper homeostasis protein CutC [Leadbetterella sp.]